MSARSLSPCWSALALVLGLAFALPVSAKPPDLPANPGIICDPDCVHRIGVDFSVPDSNGQPRFFGMQPLPMPAAEALPAPERRYPDGKVLLRSSLLGIHPVLLLLGDDVIHCDDDEPFPVIELLGEVYDTSELLDTAVQAACSGPSLAQASEDVGDLEPIQPAADEPACPYLREQAALKKASAAQEDEPLGDFCENLANLEKADSAKDGKPFAEPPCTIDVTVGRPRLLALNEPLFRTQVEDPKILDVEVPQSERPRELLLIGREVGTTVLHLWSGNPDDSKRQTVCNFRLNVVADVHGKERCEQVCKALQDEINRAFPDAAVSLTLAGDKLIVGGQVKDAVEAAKIMQIVRVNAPLGQQFTSKAARVALDGLTLANLENFILQDESTLVNALRVPQEPQVMLKVTVAEVSRSAARSMGVDCIGELHTPGKVLIDNGRIAQVIQALRNINLARSLAEPKLVTVSGQTTQFLAGGELPVPIVTGGTIHGLQGVNFVPFGVQLSFTPFVTDKHRIRLQVNATVSVRDVGTGATLRQTAGGAGTFVPGLNTRTINTTVELREGQTLAVGGLLQTNLGGDASHVPGLGELPMIGNFFRVSHTSASESELVLLVTPELVHPMAPRGIPPLPGSDGHKPEIAASECPYLRDQATKPACEATGQDIGRDVLGNLEQLEQAEKAFKIAEFYRHTGHPANAAFYYFLIHKQCPGSRYDVLAAARLAELTKQGATATPAAGQAEESEEPPAAVPEPKQDEPKPAGHSKRSRLDDEVGELLHGCQRAIAAGNLDEARRLAERALSLDAAAVLANPLVYKMQLLRQLGIDLKMGKYGAIQGGSEEEDDSEEIDLLKEKARCRKEKHEKAIERRLLDLVALEFTEAPLRKVLDDLHTWQGLNIFVDEAALGAEGISVNQAVSLRVKNLSLRSALDLLLKPLHLAYVVKDECLVITSEHRAEGAKVLRVYYVGDLVAPVVGCVRTLRHGPDGNTVDELLVRMVTQGVAPQSWCDVGGTGTIEYHPLAMALVVNQTPAVHEELEHFLGTLRELESQKDAQAEALLKEWLTLIKLGKFGGAERCAKQALRLDPDNPNASTAALVAHALQQREARERQRTTPAGDAGGIRQASFIQPPLPAIDPQVVHALEEISSDGSAPERLPEVGVKEMLGLIWGSLCVEVDHKPGHWRAHFYLPVVDLDFDLEQ